MPFRKEFAEIALASARAIQIEQGKGVIFIGDGEKPIYMAAFAAAADLPDEVAEWALEMARRRPYAKDVAQEITAFRQQEAQKRTERLRTDEAYRKQVEQRRSVPTFIPSGRKLPPWPLGPKGRVDKDFHECCTHANSLAHLMVVRPQAAAEVLLATIIEDSPEESYSSSPRLDWELGLEFDHNGYPTAYWKSPFFQFLQINQTAALETLLKLVNFCAERWAHERGDPAHQPQTIITLQNGTERVFNGDARVFDWPQTNSNRTGQLHSALAALERWLCMEIDKGVDVTPILNELLTGSNSLSVLGVLVNVGKYRPALFAGPLRCLLGNPDLYWCDDYRMKAAEYQFDAYSWARAGEVVFQMAKDWIFASYRRVPLRTIAARLISSDANVAAFVTEAIRKWKAPVDEKSALEFRILVAELNQQNYTAASGDKSAEDTLQFQCPTELQSDIVAYQRAVAPKLQALYLPTECEKALSLPRMLTGDEAGSLATALASITSEENEDTKRVARTAIASTLAAKAPAWLDQNPVVRAQVDEIIDEALAGVGETPETLRHSVIVGAREELKFVAHAVMQRWISTKGQNSELDTSVLRLMTSRDGRALATLMHIAHANRASLGQRWERLLFLALLWSGLSLLAPRQDDTPGAGARWIRWLRWLRSRKLSGVTGTAKAIDFLGIAHRVERLEEQRSKRAPAGRHVARRSSRGRHSAGLDTHVLQQSFSWLLNDASSVEDRSLVNALWEFEVWRRYEDHDEDDRDHAPPSDLGYALLQKLAKLLIVTPQTDGADIWKTVLSLGADAHYSIGHFISCWFIEVSHQQDTTGIARHWRAMLEYALAAPNWTEGSHWYYGEQQLRQLLGFSSDAQIGQMPGSQALILAMRDLYELWAGKHLIRDEDNVVGFCGFLASNAGAPLRLDGLRWLAAAIQTESRAARWHRDRTGNALVELLDVAVSQNGQELSINPAVREALVFLAAHLTARQVPAALALQERIRRIHQPVSRSG